ncbi:permease [Alphaproteobacteria bacterium]|nr:permease [Alphaproteobacteria bacterium]
MKLTDIIKSANANLLRNKGRTFLTVLAIFIGSFVIILTTGINTGVNGYIDQQMASAGGEDYIEIMPDSVAENYGLSPGSMGGGGVQEYNPNKNGSDMRVISNDDLDKIRAIDGVKAADIYHQLSTEYIVSKKADKKYTVSVGRMPTDSINVEMTSGKMVSTDAGQYQIVLLPDYATKLGFESDQDAVGQTVKIGIKNIANNKIEEVEATVTGVQNKSIVSMGRSWINKSLSDKLYDASTKGMPAQYRDQAYAATAQLVTGLSDDDIVAIKDDLKELGMTGLTVADEVGMIKTFFDAMTTVLTIFGVIALLAASIGIINTLYMSVQERTREIGLMKAMGLGASEIRLMFSLEAIMLGFWGAVLGTLAAFGARAVANSVAAETFLAELPGFTLVEFDAVNLIIVILVVMGIALLAGALPARHASKLDPIEALRYE